MPLQYCNICSRKRYHSYEGECLYCLRNPKPKMTLDIPKEIASEADLSHCCGAPIQTMIVSAVCSQCGSSHPYMPDLGTHGEYIEIPNVPKKDLVDEEGFNEEERNAHEKQVRKFLLTVIALLILAGAIAITIVIYLE